MAGNGAFGIVCETWSLSKVQTEIVGYKPIPSRKKKESQGRDNNHGIGKIIKALETKYSGHQTLNCFLAWVICNFTFLYVSLLSIKVNK